VSIENPDPVPPFLGNVARPENYRFEAIDLTPGEPRIGDIGNLGYLGASEIILKDFIHVGIPVLPQSDRCSKPDFFTALVNVEVAQVGDGFGPSDFCQRINGALTNPS